MSLFASLPWADFLFLDHGDLSPSATKAVASPRHTTQVTGSPGPAIELRAGNVFLLKD